MSDAARKARAGADRIVERIFARAEDRAGSIIDGLFDRVLGPGAGRGAEARREREQVVNLPAEWRFLADRGKRERFFETLDEGRRAMVRKYPHDGPGADERVLKDVNEAVNGVKAVIKRLVEAMEAEAGVA